MHIPVAVGLVGPNGDDMIETQVLNVTNKEQTFTFNNIGAKPVPSILRNFSAPVKLTTDLSDDDLKFLMVHDSDGFNRWESGQTYALRAINKLIDSGELDEGILQSLESLLDQALSGKGDKALLARALTLPDVQIIAQTRSVVDPDVIYAARETIMTRFLNDHRAKLFELYQANEDKGPYMPTPDAMAKRSLKNTALDYLNAPEIAYGQYLNATNMTDRVAALSVLKDHKTQSRDDAFADFHAKYKSYPLVIDKWFALQAGAVTDTIANDIGILSTHPDFNIRNPNRVRSLYAAFAMNNPVGFHRKDGSGYDLLKNAVITLNSINPQIASRILTPMREWKRYTPDRQDKMKAALQEIANTEGLSPDVFEIVSKSLNA